MRQYEEYDMRHTYGEYLMKLSYLYVKDWTTAEDIEQDVFIKFFETYQRFAQRATLKRI